MAGRRATDTQNDHDLLVRVDERQRITLEEVKKLNAALNDGLSKKLDSADFHVFKEGYESSRSDHETRLRKLETWAWGAIGILALSQFVGLDYIIKMFQ